jgi:hypothetical protein
MLARAGDQAPYSLGQDRSRYPIDELFEVADVATRPQADDLDRLLKYRVASDSAARFWVANGLLIRAMQGFEAQPLVKVARGMAGDPSAYVRCIANETLARYGTQADRSVAMKQLLEMADPRNGNVFVAMTAMNSLDWCRPTRAELGNSLAGIPKTLPGVPKRYDSYIPNLVKRLESIAQ